MFFNDICCGGRQGNKRTRGWHDAHKSYYINNTQTPAEGLIQNIPTETAESINTQIFLRLYKLLLFEIRFVVVYKNMNGISLYSLKQTYISVRPADWKLCKQHKTGVI